MNTQQNEQELKSERVPSDLVAAEEPYRIALKSERVQEEIAAGGAGGVEGARVRVELAGNPRQPLTIELSGLDAVINVHGTASGPVAG